MTPAEELPAGLAQWNSESSDAEDYEWGQYVERRDGPEWTPLVYESGGDREHSEYWAGRPDFPELFRGRCLVRRKVGPWEIVPC